MAQTIRQVCLKLLVALLRLFARPSRSGWQRSERPPTLTGM